MEINSHDFIEIFKQNFDYPIEDTLLGKCVKMDAYNAFIYSSVTGSCYFDNSYYPFTPKGLLKIFYNAFNYNFVTGMFDHSTLKNTPFYMKQSKSYLFEGDKYILPIEFEKESELQNFLLTSEELLKEKGIKSTDFILQRIERRKKGNGMEPLMEYMAAEVFKKFGFIVETQIPLTYNTGSPDFGGYSLSMFNDLPQELNYFKSGFHLIELSLIRMYKNRFSNYSHLINDVNSAIVGEAKTSTKQMTNQLKKYLDTNLYKEGYELHPFKKKAGDERFGLLTFDKNLCVKLQFPQSMYVSIDQTFEYSKLDYFNWLKNYMKYYLVANLTNDELNQLFETKFNNPVSSSNDIIKFINDYPIENLFDLILNIDEKGC